MKDITNTKLLYAKAILLLSAGVLASILLLYETPAWRTALLLAIAIWAFARTYYFAFYVIERYVDPGFRFSGLWSFLLYLLRRRKTQSQ